MMGVKISVSLPVEDLRTLDDHVRAANLPSRSAAIHDAIELLRLASLERDYAAAWEEWEASGAEGDWAGATADGLT